MVNRVLKTYQLLGRAKHQILFTVFGVNSYCKHQPSCSRYLEIQIKEHGTIAGLFKGMRRLINCR